MRGLIDAVRAAHNEMLEEVRRKNYDVIRQCVNSIHEAGSKAAYVSSQIAYADTYYKTQDRRVKETNSILEQKGLAQQFFEQQDKTIRGIQRAIQAHEESLKPKPPVSNPSKTGGENGKTGPDPKPKKEPKVRSIYRQTIFQPATLRSEDDIDRYLARVRTQMRKELQRCDEIRLQ